MRIRRDFPLAGEAPIALTIGNFDGVHLGHCHLIEQVRQAAAATAAATATALKTAVMTFEPHPLTVLRPAQPLARLGSGGDKIRQLRAQGVEILFMPRFNRRLAALPAQEFADILFSRLQTRHLLVGENFRFGKGGQGDFALLQDAAARAGARATAVPLLDIAGAPVSSGRVRACLQEGDFSGAETLLGAPWTLRGRVRRGAGRGREWGFPTANLAISFNPPLRGIFAARAEIDGGGDTCPTAAAAVSIGVNPTVSQDNIVRVEAHLLDFSADIYGKTLRLHLLHKLRDERHYDSTAALREAIADDVQATRRLLK